MAPSSSPHFRTPPLPAIRRTEAPHRLSSFPQTKKFRSVVDIMKIAKDAVVDAGADYYNRVVCEQCGSGELDEEMLLCDRCDKGFHMLCNRPIVVRVPIGCWYCRTCSGDPSPLKQFTQTKILEFFRIQKCKNVLVKCITPEVARKRRKRAGLLIIQKKSKSLLPYTPSKDPARRMQQMGSLASALISLKLVFSDELTYSHGMAPKSANQAKFECGGMQVLSKKDTETLDKCRNMYKKGECPPLIVVSDSREGYTVEADDPIKPMTFIAEYIGDVDYIKNRVIDDCDSLMTLLLATDPSESLVICPDKRGNIARFINGINNHTPEGRKKQNLKCVRYDINGESRVFLVTIRDIAKGERLYYDYNGSEDAYPTEHFV